MVTLSAPTKLLLLVGQVVGVDNLGQKGTHRMSTPRKGSPGSGGTYVNTEEKIMAYLEEDKPKQLGSTWVEAQRAKGRSAAIEEARTAGALADLLGGSDPDGCPTCGGTGRVAAK